jgi:hypothetical protein
MLDFLGITRERVYSPGKVDADRAIVDAVAARLAATHRVAVHDADEPLPADAPARVVFAMCQGPAALATLRRWAARGVRVINSPGGIATRTGAACSPPSNATASRTRPAACCAPTGPTRCPSGSMPAGG